MPYCRPAMRAVRRPARGMIMGVVPGAILGLVGVAAASCYCAPIRSRSEGQGGRRSWRSPTGQWADGRTSARIDQRCSRRRPKAGSGSVPSPAMTGRQTQRRYRLLPARWQRARRWRGNQASAPGRPVADTRPAPPGQAGRRQIPVMLGFHGAPEHSAPVVPARAASIAGPACRALIRINRADAFAVRHHLPRGRQAVAYGRKGGGPVVRAGGTGQLPGRTDGMGRPAVQQPLPSAITRHALLVPGCAATHFRSRPQVSCHHYENEHRPNLSVLPCRPSPLSVTITAIAPFTPSTGCRPTTEAATATAGPGGTERNPLGQLITATPGGFAWR